MAAGYQSPPLAHLHHSFGKFGVPKHLAYVELSKRIVSLLIMNGRPTANKFSMEFKNRHVALT